MKDVAVISKGNFGKTSVTKFVFVYSIESCYKRAKVGSNMEKQLLNRNLIAIANKSKT